MEEVIQDEKPITTSISILPSHNKFLKLKAIEKGYRSRNDLIAFVLCEWIEKEQKRA